MSQLVRISEAASLAMHTMAILGQSPQRRFTNQELADRLRASGHHLAKVMQRLVKAGYVDSVRGPQGGFCLGRPAHSLTLLAIFEVVEGPVGDGGCLLSQPICNGHDCALGEVVQSFHRQLRDYLASTTLDQMVERSGLPQFSI